MEAKHAASSGNEIDYAGFRTRLTSIKDRMNFALRAYAELRERALNQEGGPTMENQGEKNAIDRLVLDTCEEVEKLNLDMKSNKTGKIAF